MKLYTQGGNHANVSNESRASEVDGASRNNLPIVGGRKGDRINAKITTLVRSRCVVLGGIGANTKGEPATWDNYMGIRGVQYVKKSNICVRETRRGTAI